jgi:hypothetical protein
MWEYAILDCNFNGLRLTEVNGSSPREASAGERFADRFGLAAD